MATVGEDLYRSDDWKDYGQVENFVTLKAFFVRC